MGAGAVTWGMETSGGSLSLPPRSFIEPDPAWSCRPAVAPQRTLTVAVPLTPSLLAVSVTAPLWAPLSRIQL